MLRHEVASAMDMAVEQVQAELAISAAPDNSSSFNPVSVETSLDYLLAHGSKDRLESGLQALQDLWTTGLMLNGTFLEQYGASSVDVSSIIVSYARPYAHSRDTSLPDGLSVSDHYQDDGTSAEYSEGSHQNITWMHVYVLIAVGSLVCVACAALILCTACKYREARGAGKPEELQATKDPVCKQHEVAMPSAGSPVPPAA